MSNTSHAAAARPAWTLGDRLRKARETAGFTQQQLADALMVDRKTVGSAEGGRTRPFPLVIREWSRVTAVDYDWLLTGTLDEVTQMGDTTDMRPYRYWPLKRSA